MEGFMGRVELGSITGSQFAAGRSYHGVDTSPCMEGKIYGASRETAEVAAPVEVFGVTAAALGSFSALGPSVTIARNLSRTPSAK